ncbi:hypothetical protein LBW89_27145, partial [Paenibacillus sp. alder61]|uniref:hypothetical protein n=1 Tax=Paenibacillus sp. alder61 TaxID=2862948 RepID=UPI001CD37271
VKVTKTLSLNNFIVRLASLGAVWQQGVIPQEQTTRWTGGYDFFEESLRRILFLSSVLFNRQVTTQSTIFSDKINRYWLPLL